MSTQPTNVSVHQFSPGQTPESEGAVLNAIRGLRFGSVEVTIHNGRVVQIERREKVRFPADESNRKGG